MSGISSEQNFEYAQPRAFSRTDNSFLGAWWWTIDKAMLSCVLVLMLFGVALVATASPSVAQRIGVGDFHFLKKHLVFLIPSIVLLFSISMLSPRYVWRMASLLFVGTCIMMVGVLVFGEEVKGATRWINILGFSVQPSEFLKPSFAVVAAWLIALQKKSMKRAEGYHVESAKGLVFNGFGFSIGLYIMCLVMLLMQPDLGMSVVLTGIFAVQIFLVGLRFRYLAVLFGAGVGALTTAYLGFHHVRSRVDRFLYPESGDNYQVERSLDAIKQGGVIGVGPGQGTEKMMIPDVHADFIFSVLAEEMGLLFSFILIGIFLFVLLRGFRRLQETHDVFIVLAASGLLFMFGFQSFIHMGSAVNMLPTKGMTLPFISYGGSSMISMSIAMGMVLALTRQKGRQSIARSSITMRRMKS
ncbi:MAG: FtsW/RodA/SpoVE family cell cycle protein [Alphaproteobacteria bacterium]